MNGDIYLIYPISTCPRVCRLSLLCVKYCVYRYYYTIRAMPSSFWKISFLWCDCVWIVAERLPAKWRQFKLMNHSERIMHICLDFARHQVCVPDIWLPDLLLFIFFSFFLYTKARLLCVNTLASSTLLVGVNKEKSSFVLLYTCTSAELVFVVVFLVIHYSFLAKSRWRSLFVRALCL